VNNRVLFVDDEQRLLDALRRSLRTQRGKWEMHFVQNAEQALEAVRRIEFDTIVTDIRMPGKDGFELIKELQARERTSDIPIIVLTGCNEHDLKRKALDLGATDLLNKPPDNEELIARIRSAFRLKEHQDQIRIHNQLLEKAVRERTQELEQSRLDIIWRLAKAGEYRDEDTGNHILRVGCYCRAIAEKLWFRKSFIDMISLTGPLHDIGKIGIPDSILLKKGKLDNAEWEIMQTHCDVGVAILKEQPKHMPVSVLAAPGLADRQGAQSANPILSMAATIAESHHEKWDGTGYPKGLAGEQIPIEGRITAVADVYDALRSVRPYKTAFSHEKAVGIIQGDAGAHFDPRIVEAFSEVAENLREIRNEFADENGEETD